MKRIDQLTFTRFIAIVVVLFFHGGGGVYLQALSTFLPSALLVSATTSVTYLYVLSGFVMSLVYYRPRRSFPSANIGLHEFCASIRFTLFHFYWFVITTLILLPA